MLEDDARIAIPCPDCDHETEKTVKWLRRYQTMTCRNCGATIVLQTDQLLQTVEQ